jgi:hypothetical protein
MSKKCKTLSANVKEDFKKRKFLFSRALMLAVFLLQKAHPKYNKDC